MHTADITPWRHSHHFHTANARGEKNTRRVVVLTAMMMIVEIAAGFAFNSMALLADGWHMSSHVLALGITAGAYALSRRYASDQRFAFGTWKIEVLGGYTSAVVLAGVSVFMAVESAIRLIRPVPIHFDHAIPIAGIGLAVNLVSALLLRETSHFGSASGHHHDLNLRSAYLHVLADAATSLLAIAALVGGKWFGWNWLDSLMGIAGSALVAVWALSLLRETSRALLDREMDASVVGEIRDALESDGETRVSDLHVWRVGRELFACAASIVTHSPKEPAFYKSLLSIHEEIAHVTLEVNRCKG